MPTMFDALSDKFFIAFFEPDPEKRQAAIEAWIKDATPAVQSAVENELRTYLETVLKLTWTKEGWEDRVKKFGGITNESRKAKQRIRSWIESHRFLLEIRVATVAENTVAIDPVSPESRAETLKLANQTLSQIDKTNAENVAKQLRQANRTESQNSRIDSPGDDDDYGDDGGRSPNDDRSDSMNPNNDSYQASMDNRSDQMNPNNDAYWSSRGR